MNKPKTGGLPGKPAANPAAGANPPNSPVKPCAASTSPPVTPEEQQALDALGPLQGKTEAEIETELVKQGYSGVNANSGGKVFTKDLGNGKAMAVRLDPAKTRVPPKGFADEVQHAHKESIPASELKNGNYSPAAKGLTKFADDGKPSVDPKKCHIPTS